MSAIVSPHSPSAGHDRTGAPVPPYAAPAARAGEPAPIGRVGPYVPAERREAREAMTPVEVAPSVAEVESTVGVAAAEMPGIGAATMAPSTGAPGIPPYRPLRPTPIVSPAIRTPLYIPPIPTPSAESAVEDEGVIDPLLVDTAEFPIPAGTWQSMTPLDTATVPPAGDDLLETAEPVADEAPLPWIDAFLSTTPPMPVAAVEDPAPVEESWGAAGEPIAAAAEEDGWPLDEAVAEFRALGAQLEPSPLPPLDDAYTAEVGDLRVSEADGLSADERTMPMSAWSDDDLLDIMPIRHSGRTPLSGDALPPDAELWAERALEASDVPPPIGTSADAASPAARQPDAGGEEATAEQAAHALELLAQRVRAGELLLPSYDPRMGEPAALVAALAALLGVKLR